MKEQIAKDFPLDEDLYQRNADFFAEHYPAVSAKLASFGNKSGRLVIPQGQPKGVNLCVGTSLYFAEDVWELSRQQLANPDDSSNMYSPFKGIDIAWPEEVEPDDPALAINRRLRTFLKKNKLRQDSVKVERRDTAHAVIIGLGLGALLHRIVHETEYKYVILLEESTEMLHHSMYVVDFPALKEKFDERGGELCLQINKLESTWVDTTLDALRGRHFAFSKNGKLFVNDDNVVDIDSIQNLMKKLSNIAYSKGFFEDQLVMLQNLSHNLYRKKVPLFRPKSIEKPALPCFVIANGPSLDSCIATIKRFADQAIVISCGTALGSLLPHGIRPDIQVEIENVPVVSTVFRSMEEKYGLGGIVAILTSTANKDASGYFDRAYQFHRSGMMRFLHPTQRMLGSLRHTEVTAANLGVSIAGHLGFSEVYLMGVDMGTVDVEKWHASGSIYNDPKVFDEAKEGIDLGKQSNPLLPMDYRANFGGSARTSAIMQMSGARLEHAFLYFQSLFAVRYYNCCDGLALKHAIPKLPEMVHFDAPEAAKAEFLATLEEAFVAVSDFGEPAEHYNKMMNPQYIRESFTVMRDLVAKHRTEVKPDTVHPLFQLMMEFEGLLEREPENLLDAPPIYFHGFTISGSVYIWAQHYVELDANMPKKLRGELAEVWLEGFLGALDECERQILEMVAEFDDVRLARLAAECEKNDDGANHSI